MELFNFSPGSGSNRDYMPESDAKFVSSEEILRDILTYEKRDPHGLNGYILLLHLGADRKTRRSGCWNRSLWNCANAGTNL